MTAAEKAAAFRALHKPGAPFVIPNPWDAGSARMLEGLGFAALATTSSGFAMTLGRRDYAVTRDEALSHAAAVADAVEAPVNADLENGFGLSPEDAAETIGLACETGLAGGSIEDSTGDQDKPIIDDDALALARIEAALEARSRDFVLTARAEAFLYGDADLSRVIARLNAFAEAGADVVYAPGLPDMAAVRAVCESVSKPVNVLVIRGLTQHRVEDFAEAGVARLSVGGGLAMKAYATLAEAKRMLGDGAFDILSANRADADSVFQHLKG